MTNEQIVEKIRNGISVTDNMQWLYEKNMPLIKQMIRPYIHYECEEDLLQEAYFGLHEAVKHYEISKNVLFMTYAGYWIKQSVRKYIERYATLVKIPGQLKHSIASLDVPLNEETNITLCDTLQSDFSLEDETIDKVYKEHTKSELWGIVAQYTAERENHIIKEYFMNNKTLSEIAKEEHLTVGRIREIKESGLRRLRIGKAKRKLNEKFEMVDSKMYRGGVNKFNEHNFTSTVEYIVIRKAEIQEEYERRMRELSQYIPQKRACL